MTAYVVLDLYNKCLLWHTDTEICVCASHLCAVFTIYLTMVSSTHVKSFSLIYFLTDFHYRDLLVKFLDKLVINVTKTVRERSQLG